MNLQNCLFAIVFRLCYKCCRKEKLMLKIRKRKIPIGASNEKKFIAKNLLNMGVSKKQITMLV